MRLFFALATASNYVITVADTTNAYQQSPPPTRQCYLTIDDAYRSWCQKRFNMTVDSRTHVIPVLKALQGHPEAGVLWTRLINQILIAELGFRSTTHEPNLYRGTVADQDVLLCRQVDDFSIACKDPAIAERLIALINARVTTESKGLGTRYNGIDLLQTRHYLQLSCGTYIRRILQTHGWEAPAHHESDRHDLVPMSSDSMRTLDSLPPGPLEDTPEYQALQSTMGFSYRQVLGELIYAYVVCRLDIGYAVTLLSRFANSPCKEHYIALKTVCKYLRATADWGILYWRTSPNDTLPDVPCAQPSLDPSLPSFPMSAPLELTGFVDAAYATDCSNRRSVTGYVFTLAGGAVAFKSKLQATVALSSTEAEFIAAVTAAKVAKYLRSVLAELDFPQSSPTILYEDNLSAIMMINENKPTSRSRHIDIQHFAIQEWQDRGIITMKHIPGILNPSDAQTKALGWTLHSRHVRRSMGHFGPADAALPV
jgi:KUP system potassium uptake protein